MKPTNGYKWEEVAVKAVVKSDPELDECIKKEIREAGLRLAKSLDEFLWKGYQASHYASNADSRLGFGESVDSGRSFS